MFSWILVIFKKGSETGSQKDTSDRLILFEIKVKQPSAGNKNAAPIDRNNADIIAIGLISIRQERRFEKRCLSCHRYTHKKE